MASVCRPNWMSSESPSLGLRLVHSLVGQLRGRIEVHRDDGTAFVVTFPMRPAS